jgi:hypothetical protein
MNKTERLEELQLTPLKDLKPQLVCVSKLLGMDLYIDMRGEHPDKYDLAQQLLSNAFNPPKDTL